MEQSPIHENTVQCQYNQLSCIKINPHNRDPIAVCERKICGAFCDFKWWFMFCFNNCSVLCIIMSYCYIVIPALECTPHMRLIADGNYAMHIVIWNQAKPTSNLLDCWQSSKQFGWVSQANKWLLVWASIIAYCRYCEKEYAYLWLNVKEK